MESGKESHILACPRSSLLCFSILLKICSQLLNLSTNLSQPPLAVQDGPKLLGFLSRPAARPCDWYPQASLGPARACAEPLLAQTRCQHSRQPHEPRGCEIRGKPASFCRATGVSCISGLLLIYTAPLTFLGSASTGPRDWPQN